MKKKNMKLMLLLASFTISFASLGNNVQVSNVGLTGQNTNEKYTMIKFDVSWENSWKTSSYESNWDAVWVFVKFRKKLEIDWHHARLNNIGHIAPSNAVVESGNRNVDMPFHASNNPSVGVFVHRYSEGIGPVNFSEIQLRWNYGVNGLADYDSVEICVFAIEMVYIPEGAFYLGDNLFPGSSSSGHFVAGSTLEPFILNSEGPLTIGNSSPTELWGTSSSGNNTIGPNGTLPTEFPKGFRGFYVMKYELSQFMYKEFLNKLTRTQQQARVSAITTGIYMRDHNASVVPTFRNGIKVMHDPGGSSPRIYGNDLNNNGVEGEINDGQHLACNWTSFLDQLAFADWSGLRPYSELEFEKICRGQLNPVANEYSWGTLNSVNALTLSQPGQHNEIAANTNANANYGSILTINGPMRNGCFSGPSSSREQAGAAYFGVMEMSGNLWEYIISIGRIDHRDFNGLFHGDGILTASGNSDVLNWPSSPGARGGSFLETSERLRISDRASASIVTVFGSSRNNWSGIRLARTAQ